jgi:phosphohistidine phosphatase SixA
VAGDDDDDLIRLYRAQTERPLRGLEQIVELRETLLRVERLLVEQARRSAQSWDAIGGALGITRQAARRRHPDERTHP